MCNCQITEYYFEICDFDNLKNCKYYSNFIEKFPIFNVIFENTNEINISIEQFHNAYNKAQIHYYISKLIGYVEKIDLKYKKVLCTFCIYEYLLKNFNYVLDHIVLHETTSKKINDFCKEHYEFPKHIILKPMEVNELMKHFKNIFLDELWIKDPGNKIFK